MINNSQITSGKVLQDYLNICNDTLCSIIMHDARCSQRKSNNTKQNVTIAPSAIKSFKQTPSAHKQYAIKSAPQGD